MSRNTGTIRIWGETSAINASRVRQKFIRSDADFL